METALTTRVDILHKQENMEERVRAGLGREKLKGTWLGKSGLSPCPGMTTAVTEGKTGAWNTVWSQGVGSEAVWSWKSHGLHGFQQLCNTDQGQLPFLDPLCAHLGTLPSLGRQKCPG